MTGLRRTAGAALAATLLAGCTTHLEAVAPPVATVGTHGPPVNGFSYNLARLDYALDITRTVTACPSAAAPEVGFEFEAAAGSTYGAGEEILIDYAHLANAWKTTSVTLDTYPSGILKSVNAQATDHSGEAVKSAVSLAVGVAKLAIGVPPITGTSGVATGQPGEPWAATLVCTQTGSDIVKVATAAGDAKDATAKARDQAKAALDAWDADHAGDTKPSEADKAERVKLATAARTTAKAAADAATGATKTRAAASFHARGPLDTRQGSTAEHPVTAADAGAFFAKVFAVKLTKPGQPDRHVPIRPGLTFSTDPADPNALPADQAAAAKRRLDEVLTLAKVTSDFRSLRPTLATSGVAAARPCTNAKGSDPCGILYRPANPARLQVCKSTTEAACGALPAGHANILLRDEKNAPQLAGLRSLPLRNDAFEANSLVATFREDATLATVTYAKTATEGLGALSAANEVVGGLTTVDAYRRGAALRGPANAAARAKAQTELNDAITKEIEAQVKRREAEAKLKALDAASDETAGEEAP